MDRFLEANERDFDRALKEIKNGSKESHWIWYIFPQLDGLGKSNMCKTYGIKDLDEAEEFLTNEILGKNLCEITNALLEHENEDIRDIMGPIDDMKLKSCMTLFNEVDKKLNYKYDHLFEKVLKTFYNGEEDDLTLNILSKQKGEYQQVETLKTEENEENEEQMEEKFDEAPKRTCKCDCSACFIY